MKNSSKKKWKRILAMMLAVALVQGLWPTMPQVKAVNDISATVYSTVPTNGTDTAAPNQELTLKLLDKEGNSINALGIDTNWETRFKPKDSESGLYRNGTRVSSDSSAYMYAANVNEVLYLNGYGIAYAGDVFTVKGSLYDSTRNQTITFAKPQSYMWSGTEWIRIGETSVKTLSDINSGEYDNAGCIYTKFIQYDESSISADPSWNNRFEPVNGESGLFIHSNGTTTRLTSNRDDTRLIFQNGAGWGNGLYIPTQQTSDSLTVGDTLTIKGSFASPSTGESFRLQNEVTFTYNGKNWDITGETPYYSDYITFTGTLSTTGAQITSTSTQNIYLAGDSGLDEYKINSNDNWTLILSAMEGSENGIFLNGSKVDSANLRKYSDYGTWFFTEGFTASNVGDCLTIKGQFKDNKANKIASINESSFVWNGSQWSDVVYDDITLTDLHTDTNSNSSGDYWDIYINTTGTVPGTAWATVFKDVVIQTGETTISALVKNGANNRLNIFFNGTSELPTDDSIADGTPLTIKAGKYKANDGSHGIWIKEDFTIYAKNGGFTTEKPVTYQDITFTGVNVNTQYVEAHNGWFLYLTPSTALPGANDSTQFSGLTMQVGENEPFAFTFTKSSTAGTAWSLVSNTNLPQGLPEDTKIVIKTGKAESNDESDGINLTEDFVMYVKGNSFTTQIPPEYQDVEIGSVNVQTGAEKWDYMLGLTNSITDPDGIDTWGPTYSIPVKINDVDYTATVNMVGRTDAISFYLGSAGPTPVDDMMMVIKGGKYKNTDGKYGINITEDTAFLWDATNSEWKKTVSDTGIDEDVNGDGIVNSQDLVRLLRHYRSERYVPVNEARVDINLDGNKDVKDIPSLRKVLLGAIYYNRADEEGLANSPYGTPVYKRNQTIERTAYISPEATVENFAKYKAAGFTLLETQNVARYKDASPTEENQADVVAYLKKAQQYGLGVLVFSEPIHNMIVEASNDTFYYGEDGTGTKYKEILQEEVTFLKNYPAFKGFFFGDEVKIGRVEKYNKVAAYLLELDPDLILFNSQLGLYDTNAGNFSDNITDKKAAYLDYIGKFSSATNRFVYDTYTLEYNPLTRAYGVSKEWYNNLSYVAEYVKGQLPTRQVKTGVTIQACQPDITKDIRKYRYAPTMQADIGFQVYTALAYGMDEINYYKYEDHDGDEYASNFVGTNTKVYNAVKAVNAELDSFGHVFKAFSWKDTLDIAAGGSNKSTGNARLQSAASNGGRAFVGCMKDADGFDGYMVANAEGPRAEKTAMVTLTFNSATEAMIYKGTSCKTVNLTDGVCPVELAAGEGAFIIPIR